MKQNKYSTAGLIKNNAPSMHILCAKPVLNNEAKNLQNVIVECTIELQLKTENLATKKKVFKGCRKSIYGGNVTMGPSGWKV